ncbi:MAG: hypothetical protein MI723_18235, partial [Caulobacterales bacterium]|nr:hypothetical protein [Caulobacterales bacterium]
MSAVVISKRVVAINTASLVASRLIAVALLLWVNHHLLVRLTPEAYAVYPVVTALVMLLQVMTAGLTTGVARYVTEAYAKGDRAGVTEIVSSITPVIGASVLAFLAAGVLG